MNIFTSLLPHPLTPLYVEFIYNIMMMIQKRGGVGRVGEASSEMTSGSFHRDTKASYILGTP